MRTRLLYIYSRSTDSNTCLSFTLPGVTPRYKEIATERRLRRNFAFHAARCDRCLTLVYIFSFSSIKGKPGVSCTVLKPLMTPTAQDESPHSLIPAPVWLHYFNLRLSQEISRLTLHRHQALCSSVLSALSLADADAWTHPPCHHIT